MLVAAGGESTAGFAHPEAPIQASARASHTPDATALSDAGSADLPAPDLPARIPPIRVRATIPDCWLSITIKEGKNRQVRKMTAAIGFPTLRLVRWRLHTLKLGDMQPGDVKEISGVRV